MTPPMVKTLMLTGAAGFVGHHVLEHVLATTDWDVMCVGSYRRGGKFDRIAQVLKSRPEYRGRVYPITHDLTAPFTAQTIDKIGRVDYVLACASLSHVDDSLADPVPFVLNNTSVALNTLEYCRQVKPAKVLLVSTDEVYGPIGKYGRPHEEWSAIVPSNPYAASKAAQEAIAVAYWRAYGVPLILTNTMNIIGERQAPVKYLPKTIRSVLNDETVPVHGTPGNIGSRFYLHARNAADAWVWLLNRCEPLGFPAAERPCRFNVVGDERLNNLDLALAVARELDKDLRYTLVDFHSARPGHDPHYGLDGARLGAAGWKPPVPFAESLARTVRWTVDHPRWLEP